MGEDPSLDRNKTIKELHLSVMSEAVKMIISFAAASNCTSACASIASKPTTLSAASNNSIPCSKPTCKQQRCSRFIARFLIFVVFLPRTAQGLVIPVPLQVATPAHQRRQQAQQPRRTLTNKRSQRVRSLSLSDDDGDVLQVGPVDAALSWITSDVGSITLGVIGLSLLLLGRFSLLDSEIMQDENILVVQTRTDLLAVLAIGAVVFNGLSELDVATALAEQVVLDGIVVEGDSATVFLQSSTVLDQLETSKQEIAWALDSICAATPAATAVLMILTSSDSDSDGTSETWKPVACRGILPPNLASLSQDPKIPNQTPILDRFRPKENSDLSSSARLPREESYLPTLQALPGKTELVNYWLPSNTQAALLVPTLIHATKSTDSILSVGKQQAVLLLGSNQARSFTPQHVVWCQAVASRLEHTI